jgi:very-short-patch-repair endonuclease
VAEIAARQHGVVRSRDLRAAGISASAASRRRARGLLHRVHHGVDAVGHRALSREGRWLAAVFAAGDRAALGDLAATELWNLRDARGAITVIAPRQVRISGVRVRRCNRLDPRDVTVRNGIPVTTVARTIVDLAELLTAGQLANVMHEAAYRGLLDLDAVRSTAARLTGRHHAHVLDEAIDLDLAGSAGTKSEKEDAFHALLRGRMAMPIANVKVLGHEVDAFWPDRGLIAEVDGPGHRRPRARRRDRERDQKLRAAGYTVLRITDADIAERPEQVVQALVTAGVRAR